MLKVKYRVNGIFRYKIYGYSNLNSDSYTYPLVYGIRGAIMGAIITIEGIEYAKDIFNKVKNSIIYVCPNENYKKFNNRLQRHSNKYYDTGDKSLKTVANVKSVSMETIEFYINKDIPKIKTYLKNIDYFGCQESMVYLESIEEVDSLTNIMYPWDGEENVKTYIQKDWDKSIKFDNVYMFSKDYANKSKEIICCCKDIKLPV